MLSAFSRLPPQNSPEILRANLSDTARRAFGKCAETQSTHLPDIPAIYLHLPRICRPFCELFAPFRWNCFFPENFRKFRKVSGNFANLRKLSGNSARVPNAFLTGSSRPNNAGKQINKKKIRPNGPNGF